MKKSIHFYQTPGPYTDPRHFRKLLQALPEDHEQIIKFIKMVLIHPLDAKNNHVRFNYKEALRSAVDHRSIDDILTNPRVHALLSFDRLDLQSIPAQRGILSCDHHAVFFASILRLKEQAVRARCGYAAYIVPGKLTPHWTCEVYKEKKQQWEYVDPERVKLKLEEDMFLPAGKVWLDVRQGALSLAQVLPDYRNGLDGIKYRLLNDINAVMKNELLNYDWMIREAKPRAPKLFSKPVAKLKEAECSLLDTLARLSLDVDQNWISICDHYAGYVCAENLRSTKL